MDKSNTLPAEGFVRLRQIIGPTGPLPVSRSSFYAGIKLGRWPAPKKRGAMALWSVAELRACLARLEEPGLEFEPVEHGAPRTPTLLP